MKSRSRTIITRVLVFLLLGAIVNVAVAWGISFGQSVPFVMQGPSPQRGLHWPIQRVPEVPFDPIYFGASEVSGLTRELYCLPQMAPDEIDDQRRMYDLTIAGTSSAQEVSDAKAQLRVLSFIPPGDPGFFVLRVTSTGWPLVSLSGYEWEIIKRRPSQQAFERTFSMPLNPVTFIFASTGPGGVATITETRLLPFRPFFPGFAINTIFYAAILALLFCGPGKVRRFVRVRRYRCPACAYLIAPGTCASGLCSECGATLPRRLVRPATPAPGEGTSA